MTKTLAFALALGALVAGCSSGGAQEAGPVPTTSQPSASNGETGATGDSTSSSSVITQPVTPLCSSKEAAVKVATQEGAAGTIRTVWRVKNTSDHSCRSFGYPGMDFHASSGGWLGVHVHRGGYPDINVAPARIVVVAGHSLYFVSYWSDVVTNGQPCKDFDRVKVTLPDNFSSANVAASGCVTPSSVRVGPVSKTPPS
jgi:Protein of unknown function (DUF4232)